VKMSYYGADKGDKGKQWRLKSEYGKRTRGTGVDRPAKRMRTQWERSRGKRRKKNPVKNHGRVGLSGPPFKKRRGEGRVKKNSTSTKKKSLSSSYRHSRKRGKMGGASNELGKSWDRGKVPGK